ncbi:class I SAM-dependent methyltransferase [Arthrobacter sp. Br18]|uniref:SAM-dependent methyltransferase n=1 Tax=Arthrobacter sp. Br18 TaxID=1312954 RepID=UPI0004791047|nr:class I SAM-dependent methyltransferase [Arthrobacter sp. Br18]
MHTESAHDESEHAVFDQDFWDRRYAEQHRIWSGNPNPQLVAETRELPPGHALDVGCGEGADALWLAGRDWRVTAVDISPVALARAREQAEVAEVAQAIEWLAEDLLSWVPEPRGYDLVSVQFMQLPQAARTPLFQRLAASVAPGGMLLIVGHHPSDMHTTAHRPPIAELFYTPEEVAGLLDESWTITVCEARPRPTTDPGGNPVTIHDSVLVALRSG